MHPGTYKTNSMSIAVAYSAENMQDLDIAGVSFILNYTFLDEI